MLYFLEHLSALHTGPPLVKMTSPFLAFRHLIFLKLRNYSTKISNITEPCQEIANPFQITTHNFREIYLGPCLPNDLYPQSPPIKIFASLFSRV
jgi:hypothetical protein